MNSVIKEIDAKTKILEKAITDFKSPFKYSNPDRQGCYEREVKFLKKVKRMIIKEAKKQTTLKL